MGRSLSLRNIVLTTTLAGLNFYCAPPSKGSAPADPSHPGPYVVSRPPAGVAEYIVTLYPAFDHFVYADSIAHRVKGKVGYIYSTFNAFTLHSLSDIALAELSKMREVQSVEKSKPIRLD